ncbi:MAG: hypothetical protein PHR51_00930 [Patescibacteria group bacterium]|nr:hypothetical protein [Patescibacteria group bacterium]
MGKKHKARLKEIERLKALYGQSVDTSRRELSAIQPTATMPTAANVNLAVDDHSQIRRDLIGLIVLIAVMVAVLIGLNWLVAHTGFGGWLIGLFGI